MVMDVFDFLLLTLLSLFYFLTAAGFFSDDIFCVPVFPLSLLYFWLISVCFVMTFSLFLLDFLTAEGFFRDDILAISFWFFDYWSLPWWRHFPCFFWIFWLLKPSLVMTSLFPFWFFDYWRFLWWIHYHCFFRILWLQKVSLGMTFSFCLYIQGSFYKLSDQELSLFTFPTFVKLFLFFLNLPFFQLPL